MMISKLPMRQISHCNAATGAAKVSKLPMRQIRMAQALRLRKSVF